MGHENTFTPSRPTSHSKGARICKPQSLLSAPGYRFLGMASPQAPPLLLTETQSRKGIVFPSLTPLFSLSANWLPLSFRSWGHQRDPETMNFFLGVYVKFPKKDLCAKRLGPHGARGWRPLQNGHQELTHQAPGAGG